MVKCFVSVYAFVTQAVFFFFFSLFTDLLKIQLAEFLSNPGLHGERTNHWTAREFQGSVSLTWILITKGSCENVDLDLVGA